MTALLRWWKDEIPADIDGREVWANDTDRMSRMHLWLHWEFVRLETQTDVMRFYLRLNGAGTPHTKEELDRVRALLDSAERAKKEGSR